MSDLSTDNPKRWWVFLGVGLIILLVNIDATIVNLALASIAKNLSSTLTQIQWVINAYLLTGVMFFILAGKLSDRFGLKKNYLIGLTIFGLASLICGLAHNIDTLVVGRLLQGFGFAFTFTLAIVMVSHEFPAEQRGFMMGMMVTIAGLGQALGPNVGGILLSALNWHWIFLINVPVSVISFLIISSLYHTRLPKNNNTIDFGGMLLFGISIASLLLAFNTLDHPHPNYLMLVIYLAIFILFALIFFFKEIHTKYPLVVFPLFRIRNYTLSILIRFWFMFGFGTLLFFLPLYLQNILGQSALDTGLVMLVYAALFGICSPMAGIWADKVGYKRPINLSLILAIASFICFAFLRAHTDPHLVILALILFGLSCGIIVGCTTDAIISSLHIKNRSEGVSMFYTSSFIAVSLGVAIGGTLLNWLSKVRFAGLLQQTHIAVSNQQAEVLSHMVNGAQRFSDAHNLFSASEVQQLAPLIHHSFMHGFDLLMGLNAILCGVSFILSLFLIKKRDLS